MLSRLVRWIERHPGVHRASLSAWRAFPPRLAGFLKGVLTRSWVVGAVAVMLDEEVSPPELLLVEHSYRSKGAWGLPGGALDSIPGDARAPGSEASADDVIETTLQREVWEELGIGITNLSLLRVDAVPYIPEEPGPDRLDFYFRCVPEEGFAAFRAALESGGRKPRSPEILRMRMVPLPEIDEYDLFSSDARLLRDDLPRLVPTLAAACKAAFNR
jgi:8-oxo-dGTP pyrophosphatase MutT (NUDIX family)